MATKIIWRTAWQGGADDDGLIEIGAGGAGRGGVGDFGPEDVSGGGAGRNRGGLVAGDVSRSRVVNGHAIDDDGGSGTPGAAHIKTLRMGDGGVLVGVISCIIVGADGVEAEEAGGQAVRRRARRAGGGLAFHMGGAVADGVVAIAAATASQRFPGGGAGYIGVGLLPCGGGFPTRVVSVFPTAGPCCGCAKRGGSSSIVGFDWCWNSWRMQDLPS